MILIGLLAVIFIMKGRFTCRVSNAGAEPPAKGPQTYSQLLSRKVLEESLFLGTRFMLNNQYPEGNFTYEYDWQGKKHTKGDSQVRQAGAAWGLTLINQYHSTPQLEEAIKKALAFFKNHSKTTDDGRRYVIYPGDVRGAMGTVALMALAHIDFLRAVKDKLSENEVKELTEDLNEYLYFLLEAQRPDGLWRSRYQYETGEPFGNASPYSDGEALLALTKAAKYLGREDLWETAIRAADAGHRHNIAKALKIDPDSRTTKGYYQWSSMAFFEIATSDRPGVVKYGTYVMELADWMIDVHKTLERTRNTAYAYEGIIHAYEMARRRDIKDKADKFRYVIERGLEKLISWQVGSSIANSYIKKQPTEDLNAVGGVQNHREEARLRIDVTQHQMHAIVLALKYVFSD